MSTSPLAAVYAPIGPYQLNPNPRTAADSYWNEVHKIANKIFLDRDGEMPVYITSLDNAFKQVIGGRVFETDFRTAAMRIVERSHQLSTPEEIAGEMLRLRIQEAEYADLTEKRKHQSILKPSQEQMQVQADLIGTVVQAVIERMNDKPRHSGKEPKPSTD